MPDYLSIARRALLRPETPKGTEPLEGVLKGLAIELWSDRAGCLFIVADEEDARRLGEPRGTVYTADELRRVFQIGERPGAMFQFDSLDRGRSGLAYFLGQRSDRTTKTQLSIR